MRKKRGAGPVWLRLVRREGAGPYSEVLPPQRGRGFLARILLQPIGLLISFGGIDTRQQVGQGVGIRLRRPVPRYAANKSLHRIDLGAPRAGLDVEDPHFTPVIFGA